MVISHIYHPRLPKTKPEVRCHLDPQNMPKKKTPSLRRYSPGCLKAMLHPFVLIRLREVSSLGSHRWEGDRTEVSGSNTPSLPGEYLLKFGVWKLRDRLFFSA